MNDVAPAIPRLGVPEYNWWNEALHGVARSGLATVFPQAIGLAATWNDSLMLRIATVISDEARAKYHDYIAHDSHQRYQGLTFWSPNINLFRDPRWGRGQETYGEDPYLTGTMGVQFIRGLQGNDPKYLKTVSTVKHFAVHSGPEPERHTFDAVVSERDLRESYLPHFEMGIKDGGAYSLMCAYNSIDGKPACASDMLLRDILRDEWKFPGYIVSDCGAIDDIHRRHKYAATPAQAAADGVKTGTDLECSITSANSSRTYTPSLPDAVRQGLISEAQIDTSVYRLFLARFKLGMFDDQSKVRWASIPISDLDSPMHHTLALHAARESIVLLKNERNTLPLSKSLKTVAVIGPNADQWRMLLGNYNGMPSDPITPLRGIRQALPEARVLYARRLRSGRRLSGAGRRSGEGSVVARRHAGADRRVLQVAHDRGHAAVHARGPDGRRELEGRRAARRHESGRFRRAMVGHAARAGDGHVSARPRRYDEVPPLPRRQLDHAVGVSVARRRVSGSAAVASRAAHVASWPVVSNSSRSRRDVRPRRSPVRLVGAARRARSRGARRGAAGRRRRVGARTHRSARGRGDAGADRRLSRRRSHEPRPSGAAGAADGEGRRARQADGARADERERRGRELGAGPRAGDRRGVVSGAGVGHGDRRRAVRRLQPGRPICR